MIVIFGAGHVGGRLARLLIGSESVRVTTRRADRLQALAALGVVVVEARLDEPESLSAALEGAERAVYTMAPGRSGDPSGVYGDGLRCLVELARRRGIGRFVLCSSTAVYDREDDGGFVDEQAAVASTTLVALAGECGGS